MANRPKPLVLLILDGFRMQKARDNQAIELAGIPCRDDVQHDYPVTALGCLADVLGFRGEQMVDEPNGQEYTVLALNLVSPARIGGGKPRVERGVLAEWAATRIAVLGMSQTNEMTSRPLIG